MTLLDRRNAWIVWLASTVVQGQHPVLPVPLDRYPVRKQRVVRSVMRVNFPHPQDRQVAHRARSILSLVSKAVVHALLAIPENLLQQVLLRVLNAPQGSMPMTLESVTIVPLVKVVLTEQRPVLLARWAGTLMAELRHAHSVP